METNYQICGSPINISVNTLQANFDNLYNLLIDKMKSTKLGIVAIVVMLMCSCAQSEHHHYEKSAANREVAMDMATEQESVSENQSHAPETYISSSAALENPNDTTRRMIRTANIRFKVKDVVTATYNIENIVVKNSGFVENTRLTSQINHTKETAVKEDSTLLTTYYTVMNTLVLRVPSAQLDATLQEIARFVEFMDYRTINAKDVTLDLLSKKLEQNRLARYDSRMTNAIDNQGKRLNDINSAEDNLLRRQAQADEAKLANLHIFDQIKFSTVTLYLYQNQSIKYEVITKEKVIKPYSPPLGTRFIDALTFGWTIIVAFFLFIINIWSIILMGVLVFWGVNYFRKRISKRKSG
jgi:uncharacterized membrane protein